MTELFRPDGHLTDEGLEALIGGELDELGRLEAAEHLSFCDACLVRYTALLEGDVLQEPPTDQTLPVMRRLRRRAAQALMSRYTAAAAAVLITGTLWYSGIFADIAGVFTVQGQEMTPRPPAASQPAREEEPGSAILRAVSDWSERCRALCAPPTRPPSPKQRPTGATTPMPRLPIRRMPPMRPQLKPKEWTDT